MSQVKLYGRPVVLPETHSLALSLATPLVGVEGVLS